MAHSDICGSSNADRCMVCTASVELVRKMPPKEENEFMARGTLLHSAIETILLGDGSVNVVGMQYGDQTLTQELYEDKIIPALASLDEIDPDQAMEYEVESTVSFGDLIPGVFGTGDFFGRYGKKAIVLDWKFGDGVPVEAEENEQLLFNAAAGMRTQKTKWVFEGAEEIEMVIVQPPHIRRWTTTPERVKAFEASLVAASKKWLTPKAEFKAGPHCKWCAAKPICPRFTQAVERAVRTKIEGLDASHINGYLKNVVLLKAWIEEFESLAHRMMENGVKLEDWKLVAKRGTRKWADEPKAKEALLSLGLAESEVVEASMVSPAAIEKVLKKRKLTMPEDLIVSISSGSTVAKREDPRAEVLNLGQQLAGLSKLM